jgi:hypothetical protein
MSRFKRFAHSLVSGYALLVVNVLYTLASVPLALHYLSKEEFGLWAVVSQICNFNMLVVDLGMSGAVARILIDHKDDSTSTKYGGSHSNRAAGAVGAGSDSGGGGRSVELLAAAMDGRGGQILVHFPPARHLAMCVAGLLLCPADLRLHSAGPINATTCAIMPA